MKVIVAWLCLVALALVAAGSCSIKHQSEQYECDTNADCVDLGDDRVCSDGLCVVTGGGPKDAAIDAPKPPTDAPDQGSCPSQCTSCNFSSNEKTCIVDCSQNPSLCSGQMACPAGYACTFKCNTPSSCRNGVNCQAGTACNIECTGSFSCRNVACGIGPCDIKCTGNNACSGISCGASCACDVSCGDNASCFNVQCGKPQCDVGAGCSSQPPTCDTCP